MKAKKMNILLFTTVLFSGLAAGLFYAYSCSVNIGLNRLSDLEYLQSMQAINEAIQNPVFFATFLGLLLLLPLTTFFQYRFSGSRDYWLILATAVYFTGVFGVTIFGNVPLNEQLAKFSAQTATAPELAAMRKLYEQPWNTLHTLRTIAAVVSFGLVLIAILKQRSLTI